MLHIIETCTHEIPTANCHNADLFFITSCNKKDETSPGEILGSIESRKAADNSFYYSIKYNYSTTGQLSSVKHSGDFLNELTYNNLGLLLTNKYYTINHTPVWLDSFIYNNNHQIIIKSTTAILPNLAVSDHTFSYDSKGRLVSDSEYVQRYNNSSVRLINIFEYDNNDNVVIAKYYSVTPPSGTFGLNYSETYSYDDKVNPYYRLGLALYFAQLTWLPGTGKHNLIEIKTTPASTGNNNTVIAYKYFSNSLPRSAFNGGLSTSNAYNTAYIFRH